MVDDDDGYDVDGYDDGDDNDENDDDDDNNYKTFSCIYKDE